MSNFEKLAPPERRFITQVSGLPALSRIVRAGSDFGLLTDINPRPPHGFLSVWPLV